MYILLTRYIISPFRHSSNCAGIEKETIRDGELYEQNPHFVQPKGIAAIVKCAKILARPKQHSIMGVFMPLPSRCASCNRINKDEE